MIPKTKLMTGLATSLILGLLGETPVIAQDIYIDSNCKQNQQLAEFDRFTVMYKSEFQTKGKIYWLYSGQYIDGSSIVCISRPGFRQAKLLNIQQIQSGYVEKISKSPRNRTAFLVTVRYGNGSDVPTTQYQLNLSIPEKPVITKLRSWKS